MWTNQRNVGCSLYIRTTIYIATNEVKSFGSVDIVDKLVPAEIASDGNTKIRMGVYHIQQGITKRVI